MRILFVNHTGLKSGAENATLDLLTRLPCNVEPLLACPPGRFADDARGAGLTVRTIYGMDASLRLHYANTPRGVAQLGRMAWDVGLLARRSRAQLVHATSIRAGLAASLHPGPGLPVAVSLHDCLPRGAASAVTRRLVDARAAVVLANSRHTAQAWRAVTRAGPPLRVVYPGIDVARYAAIDRRRARDRLGVSGNGPLLGVVAQITPWKGQATAIRALQRVRQRLPGVELALVGEPKFVERATRYDNYAYLRELRALVAALGLETVVHFLGQRDDMPEVMAAIDVLLVPSIEEPFGLVVVEAMASGTPVVATRNGGPAEIIRDGIDGRLVPPSDAERWATTVSDILLDPVVRTRMTHAGHDRARRFSAERYAVEVVAAYEQACRPGC